MWKILRDKVAKMTRRPSLYSWSFKPSYERFTQGWSGEKPTVLSTEVSNDTMVLLILAPFMPV
jgi:hypothetical protein